MGARLRRSIRIRAQRKAYERTVKIVETHTLLIDALIAVTGKEKEIRALLQIDEHGNTIESEDDGKGRKEETSTKSDQTGKATDGASEEGIDPRGDDVSSSSGEGNGESIPADGER